MPREMTRSERFMDKLREAGGSCRVAWSTKRHPDDRYDNVRYLFVYGRPNEHGRHPLICGVILNELDECLEVCIASTALTYDEDVTALLDAGDAAVKERLAKEATRSHNELGKSDR